MYKFKNWINPNDPKLIELKNSLEEKTKTKCELIPKTEGHKYQESLSKSLSVALENAINGCAGTPMSLSCYEVGSSGAGSGSGDVTISRGSDTVKIECKRGVAQGGDLTFSYDGQWKFKGIAQKMCPTKPTEQPLKAALCRSIMAMLDGPLGKSLLQRAKAINEWQQSRYTSDLVGAVKYPLATLKESWLVAADKFPMRGANVDPEGETATYYNVLSQDEYWRSLEEILVKKGDHFIQFFNHGMYMVDRDPLGLGESLGVPMLSESITDTTKGGRVEVRLRPSGFSKSGGRLTAKSGVEVGESKKGKTKGEKNRGLIVKCNTKPVSGMHIHVPQLGKKAAGADIYEYDIKGHPSLKAKMAGTSLSTPYDYIASTRVEEGEYIGSINFTEEPIDLGGGKWYVRGTFNHRTANVSLSAILRIDDKVTSTLKPSSFTLDNPSDMMKMISKLKPCK